MTDIDIAAVLNDRDAATLARYLDETFEAVEGVARWHDADSGVVSVIYTDEDWGKEALITMCWIARDAGYPLHFDGAPADDDWDGFRSALAREVTKRSDPQSLPPDQTRTLG